MQLLRLSGQLKEDVELGDDEVSKMTMEQTLSDKDSELVVTVLMSPAESKIIAVKKG